MAFEENGAIGETLKNTENFGENSEKTRIKDDINNDSKEYICANSIYSKNLHDLTNGANSIIRYFELHYPRITSNLAESFGRSKFILF